MSGLVGPDGQPVTSKGKPAGPGLDLQDPMGSLDLLGSVAKGCYIMAHQYAGLAGPKGERHVKVLAKDISGISSQGAAVAEFASNAIAELSFTLAEAEARIAVMLGAFPEGQVNAAKEADLKVAVEWENRRRLFSGEVPIALKLKKRLGIALAEAITGPAPTEETFKKQIEDAKAAGMNVQEPGHEGHDHAPGEGHGAPDGAPAPAAAPTVVDGGAKGPVQASPDPPPELRVVDGGKAN